MVTAQSIPYQFADDSHASDIVGCFSSANKEKALLGWKATPSFTDMCIDTWHWQARIRMDMKVHNLRYS